MQRSSQYTVGHVMVKAGPLTMNIQVLSLCQPGTLLLYNVGVGTAISYIGSTAIQQVHTAIKKAGSRARQAVSLLYLYAPISEEICWTHLLTRSSVRSSCRGTSCMRHQ